MTTKDLAEGLTSGSRAHLARAITLIESVQEADMQRGEQVLEAVMPYTGNALRVGVTGAPGSGKSTLIEQLGLHLIASGERVALLTIDPSSAVGSGSILGDKTRMPKLSNHEHAFIRPSPSGGLPGGVAHATRTVSLLCEAAGYTVIMIETVGTGQSEVAVRSVVDVVMLLVLAGAGDELQGIKRGILETADILAVSKADGDNERQAKITAGYYRRSLGMYAQGWWRPRVRVCSGRTGQGIPMLWEDILDWQKEARRLGHIAARRRAQALADVERTASALLSADFARSAEAATVLKAMRELVHWRPDYYACGGAGRGGCISELCRTRRALNRVDRMERTADFIRTIIERDLQRGECSEVVVRFPPEPNGYPHIGHAKSSTLNFGIAAEYGGRCHLRFDDTNPVTEKQRYVDAIKRDLRWMGFDWGVHEYYASDYFEQLYAWACVLIRKGLAYVDDSTEDAIRAMRGTVTEPGTPSPYRDRRVEENLELFEGMRRGQYAAGERVLRARIDLAHPNMKMRDPLMYRIRYVRHYRRGRQWCIFPFYDWAHGQSDAIEGITHSICTLEFETNRVLYDWYLDALEIAPRPRQYEFARLNLDYTVTSKRKLLYLVENAHVDGWSDPRMPTLAGLRRRGVRPKAIRTFCESVGTTRVDSTYDPAHLEHAIRDDLNSRAPRVMCVLDPLPVTLTNWPHGKTQSLDVPSWPRDVPRTGSRAVAFAGELYIERTDYCDDPPRGYRRLAPGRAVRLMHAGVIRCDHVERNAAGDPVCLHCTWFSAGPSAPRPTGTIHWVEASTSVPVVVRRYDRLFGMARPSDDFVNALNPKSLVEYASARIEPGVLSGDPDARYQFVRSGYYWPDPDHSTGQHRVFNCIVPLREGWKTAPAAKPSAPAKEALTPAAGTLDSDEADWLEKEGLSAAVGLAIRGTSGGEEFLSEAARHAERTAVANWMANHLLPGGRALDALPFDARSFGELVALYTGQSATAHEVRGVLEIMMESGGRPATILEQIQADLRKHSDGLSDVVDQVLEAHADRVQVYLNGKTGLLGFFVGQVMRRTDGKASPNEAHELVSAALARMTE